MHIKEIVISPIPSDPVEEQPRNGRVYGIALKQHNRIRLCKCAFELFNQHFLSIIIDEAFHRTREYELHIGILDPEPVRSLRVNWGHLAAFFVLAVTAGLAGSTNLLPDSGIWPSLLGACAGLFLILCVYRSHDHLVFYSRNGRIPLVILFNRNPDRETFSRFITVFTEHIREASANLNLVSGSERLNTELREHRRLMEEDIISRKRYDIAKSRILDLHR
ncbi:MAG: hypothetical protein ABFS22_00845 [Pseudomonadota bacterium]